MARIPESFVDSLLQRVDIVELIGKRLQLKRAGREFQARCPFHDERTASFTISPQKQFYHCFGCGAHGTALGFVMNYENLEFVDAVESLASELGMEVPYEGGGYKRADGSDALFPVLADATQFFIRHLQVHDAAKEYLAQRGVDRAMMDRFQLGFAPADGNLIVQALGTTPERRQALVQAGLSTPSQSGRGEYGKFRERLMFPILDKRGRCIAFGGRIIGQGEPKYLNSPETALFKKSQELYGLYFARQQKLERMLVVEGYMDVLSLVQFGVHEAVATLGTATSREHAEILFRNADDVVFCFDGDRAGRAAAWRALGSVLPRMRDGRQAHFLFLPDGEDPDSIVRKEGEAGMRARLKEALPASKYLFEEVARDCDLTSIDGRARFAERAKPLLQTIPEGAYAELMQAELERLSGLNARRIEREPELGAGSSRGRATQRARTPTVSRRWSTEFEGEFELDAKVRIALTRLLGEPGLAALAPPPYAFAAMDAAGTGLLLAVLELAREREGGHGSSLIAQFEGQGEHALLLSMLAQPSVGDDRTRSEEFLSALEALNQRASELRKAQLTKRFVSGGLSDAERQELLALQAQKSGKASF